MRWQGFLSDFNLEISYMPGAENNFADGLSRRADLRLLLIGAVAPYDPWLSSVKAAYADDPAALKLFRTATGPKQSLSYRTRAGVLYYVAKGAYRVYVPDAHGLRNKLLHDYHCAAIAGHYGASKVLVAMSQHYYWPCMPADVEAFVRACPVCQVCKPTQQPTPSIKPLPVPDKPFQHITLDWLSGFPENKAGNPGTLNIIDRFSKWAVVIPCPKTMGDKAFVDALYVHFFSWAGLPGRITGDRDTRLTASRMRSLCKGLDLQLKLSVAYHPQTDGQTESFHKTFLSMLRTQVNRYHSDWQEAIPALLYAYHNTVHSATGYTPHLLLFGWTPRDLRAPLSSPLPASGHADVDAWLARRADHFATAQVRLEHARQSMIRARKASAAAHSYAPGDLVKVFYESASCQVRYDASKQIATALGWPLSRGGGGESWCLQDCAA